MAEKTFPTCKTCQFWGEEHSYDERRQCEGYPSRMTNERVYTPSDWGCPGHSNLVDRPEEYQSQQA